MGPDARRYIIVGIALALLFGVLGPATTPRGQVAVKTVLFLPQVLPQVPFKPLESLTPAPLLEEVRYGSPSARGLLYRPGDGKPRGAWSWSWG
ncbi:MAG: hypothetical protein HY330_06930 [Chloroflexi bacterium]|nr:hypothetical protein [Chloroflexota bacterium]